MLSSRQIRSLGSLSVQCSSLPILFRPDYLMPGTGTTGQVVPVRSRGATTPTTVKSHAAQNDCKAFCATKHSHGPTPKYHQLYTSQRKAPKLLPQNANNAAKWKLPSTCAKLTCFIYFQDDFEGYTEEDFKLVNNNDIRKLRNFLRRQGVWIEKSRLTIAKSLFNALQEKEPTQWTNTDIQEYLSTEGAFDSYRINYRIKKNPIAHPSGIVPPSIPPIIKPTTSVSIASTNNLPQAPSNSHTPSI